MAKPTRWRNEVEGMMRFQLTKDWPVGQFAVPTGTQLTFDPDGYWNGVRLPLPAPVNAQALDQAAYDHLLANYPYYVILTGPGVVRHGDPKAKADVAT